MAGLRVLGIDCGSTSTGYGVVESDGRSCRVLGFGVIRASRQLRFAQRLKRIHQQVEKLLKRYAPDAIAIEKVFLASNVKSQMQMSQVCGVVLLAAERAQRPVHEYSARTIKSSMVGFGGAEKHQVQLMVQRLLDLPKPPEPADASDALAVALCHIRIEEGQRKAAGRGA
ncbi:MAG: crossover junction endodeoxyribonuclease RuvC [Terriglobia bacterium]